MESMILTNGIQIVRNQSKYYDIKNVPPNTPSISAILKE